MVTLTKAQLIGELFDVLKQVCVDHIVDPFELLQGAKRKNDPISTARREFAAIVRRRFCQWSEDGIYRFGAIEFPSDWRTPGVAPLSTVRIGKFLGLDHSTIVLMNNQTAGIASREPGGDRTIRTEKTA